MSTPPRYITAQLNDGKDFTATYKVWAEMNNVTKESIQKRQSVSNKYLEMGKRPYTQREIVGLQKLKRSNVKRGSIIKKPVVNKTIINTFLSRRLV